MKKEEVIRRFLKFDDELDASTGYIGSHQNIDEDYLFMMLDKCVIIKPFTSSYGEEMSPKASEIYRYDKNSNSLRFDTDEQPHYISVYPGKYVRTIGVYGVKIECPDMFLRTDVAKDVEYFTKYILAINFEDGLQLTTINIVNENGFLNEIPVINTHENFRYVSLHLGVIRITDGFDFTKPIIPIILKNEGPGTFNTVNMHIQPDKSILNCLNPVPKKCKTYEDLIKGIYDVYPCMNIEFNNIRTSSLIIHFDDSLISKERISVDVDGESYSAYARMGVGLIFYDSRINNNLDIRTQIDYRDTDINEIYLDRLYGTSFLASSATVKYYDKIHPFELETKIRRMSKKYAGVEKKIDIMIG